MPRIGIPRSLLESGLEPIVSIGPSPMAMGMIGRGIAPQGIASLLRDLFETRTGTGAFGTAGAQPAINAIRAVLSRQQAGEGGFMPPTAPAMTPPVQATQEMSTLFQSSPLLANEWSKMYGGVMGKGGTFLDQGLIQDILKYLQQRGGNPPFLYQ